MPQTIVSKTEKPHKENIKRQKNDLTFFKRGK